MLLDVATPPNRPAKERAAALLFLTMTKGIKKRPSLEATLWRLYCQDKHEVVRLTALGAMAKLRLRPSDPAAAADYLYRQTIAEATCPEMKAAIERAWPKLFTEESLLLAEKQRKESAGEGQP